LGTGRPCSRAHGVPFFLSLHAYVTKSLTCVEIYVTPKAFSPSFPLLLFPQKAAKHFVSPRLSRLLVILSPSHLCFLADGQARVNPFAYLFPYSTSSNPFFSSFLPFRITASDRQRSRELPLRCAYPIAQSLVGRLFWILHIYVLMPFIVPPLQRLPEMSGQVVGHFFFGSLLATSFLSEYSFWPDSDSLSKDTNFASLLLD